MDTVAIPVVPAKTCNGILFSKLPFATAIVLIAAASGLVVVSAAVETVAAVETAPANNLVTAVAPETDAVMLTAEASGMVFVSAPAVTAVVLADVAKEAVFASAPEVAAVVLIAPARFTVGVNVAAVVALTEMSEARATVLPASDENGAWENAEMPNMAGFYSYRMLIEPASNVSVPPAVVKRIAVSAPDKVTLPPPTALSKSDGLPIALEQTQIFPDMLMSVIVPDSNAAACAAYEPRLNPSVAA